MATEPGAVAPAVEASDVMVSIGRHPILRGVGFSVPIGNVVGLLGPSGCGKTSLMRVVVGVQELSAGHVRVLGRPAGSPELRRRIGYVTQSASVYDDMTVRDNLRYFAAVAGVSLRAAERALRDVALVGQVRQRVGTLSGGQRARVSLACALLASPELLVLDEPTVGLDPILREDLWAQFHQLAAEGTTLFVSSHVMDEAARCDRLLLMREGRLIADDAPEALRQAMGVPDLETAFVRILRPQPERPVQETS